MLEDLEQEDKQVSIETIDHILTLQAIIKEAKFQKSPIFSCFVDFRKAFDNVPQHRLMDGLTRLGILELALQLF